MAHTRSDNDIDVCKAENLEDVDCYSIMPHSFFLNSNSHFQAYEYEYESSLKCPRPLPGPDFLFQIHSFLVENQLTNLVSILAEDTRQDSVEYLLPDEQGMICVPCKEVGAGKDGTRSSVITGWRFCEELDGRIRCVERRKCEPQGEGQHKVKEGRTVDA